MLAPVLGAISCSGLGQSNNNYCCLHLQDPGALSFLLHCMEMVTLTLHKYQAPEISVDCCMPSFFLQWGRVCVVPSKFKVKFSQ